MKSLFYLLLILSISLLGSTRTDAQIGGEGRVKSGNGYWVLGLNAGGAWQDSDVSARLGGGWGFYLGHSIFNRPNSFFSADLRFRYMNTYTYGQNHSDSLFGNATLADTSMFSYRPDTANFAHNYETTFHDLSLELRLNFEELRRKTNVWLSIYGGIGLGIYGTKFDQKDAAGNDYDYGSLDQTKAPRDLCEDIISLRDHDYETNAFSDGFGENQFKLTATPSIGIELGYWFTPNFALGIGHRVTFTLQDNFEGISINSGSGLNSSIHHYTALLLNWRLVGKKNKVKCPEARFQLPVANNETYTTNQPTAFVKATVSNVTQNQITYTINGQTASNFTYNENDDVFQSNVQLQKGENKIVIQATNSCGTDGQNITIIYDPNKEPDPVQPPIVTITTPGTSPITIKTPTTFVNAQILHVTGKNNVIFKVNGVVSNSFNFSGTSFQSNAITLLEGQNTITVQGSNKDGTDSKTVIINYEKELPLPVVNITNPSANPHTVSTSQTNIAAQILNVASRNDVTFTVNGQQSTNFSFSGTSFTANNINLNLGSNTMTITGRNTKGQDSETVVIVYQAPKPVVTITKPTKNPYSTNIPTATITATILNVASASDVTFTVNGQVNSNFSFSGTSFSANLNLVQGNNTVTITGRNNVGQDSKTTVLIYQKAVQPPVVTITNPTSNPYNTQAGTGNVMANITNVANRNNVTCTVNGQVNNNFAFTGTNFSLSNFTLIPGANTVTITGRNEAGQDSKTTTIIYNRVVEQPPVVTITNPTQNPFTTQSSKVNINATILNVASKSDVSFSINGMNLGNFSFSGTTFTANNINLKTGANTFVITGRNKAGQDSKTTVVIYSKPVELEPSVVITYPNQNPFNTQTAQVNIVATINNVASRNDVTFTVNGQSLTNFSFTGTVFTANNIALKTGSNTFVITGRNSTGQASASTVVVYQKPVERPTVNITSPGQNPFNTNANQVNIVALIKNVSNKNDVTFTVNGQNNTNFSFSGTNFTANNVNLNEGSNTFVITGRNSAGQATASTVVVYKKPVERPTVNITSPGQNPFNTNANQVNIVALIKNVSSKNDVTFTVNGQATTNFNFSGTSFTANNINLNEGSNAFVITGRNSAGQATASTVVIYKKPVERPVVTITSPGQNPFNTNSNQVNIAAQIKNVASKNDVSFTINGQNNTNFSFSGTNFTANNINLNEGSTTFTITGRNSAGQDTKSTVVIYRKPLDKPIVTITYPGQNPFNTASNQVNIKAQIQNVSDKSGVTFTVNGQPNANFSFSGTNFIANNIAIGAGTTSFTITGRNKAGQDSKTTVVIYKPLEKPVVTITSPAQSPFTTTANQVNIAAQIKNVSDKSGVTFTVNGQPNTNFSFSGTNFAANNIPISGTTTFLIIGRNKAGQDMKTTIVVHQKPVLEPTVQITSPGQNPYTVTVDKVNITAQIKNVANKNNVTFTVNGQANGNFAFSGTSFTANNVTLNEGSNTFVITGSNSTGQASASTVVVYKKPVQEPTVQITSPGQNPYTVTVDKVNITAQIKNVSGKSNVTFMVNGQANGNFAFSGTSFTANNVTLNEGSNTFVITGSNSTGQASASTVVVYKKPVQEPTVQITSPGQNPYTVTVDKVNITAQIKNVSGKSNVTFTVNGQANGNFAFSGTSFTANNVTLNEGSNTFVITGSNSTGQASASTVVVYKKPVQEPTVQITSPGQNPYTVTVDKVNITAQIKNVSGKSNVTFTVNGQANGNFAFSGTNFTANNVTLNEGSNTFVITGSNSTGQASASTVVVYKKPVPKPTVTITEPTANPFTIVNNKVNIKATVTNVSGKSNVTFTVNGQANSNFSFSGTSFVANNVTLVSGNNTFVIKGQNSSGQDSKSTVVVYNPPIRPTVSITSPGPNISTSNINKIPVLATISNIATKSQITFTVNGVVNSNFTFNGTNFVANDVQLQLDTNRIIIKAVNPGGFGIGEKTVIYNKFNPGGNNSGNGVQTGGGTKNPTGGGATSGGNGPGGEGGNKPPQQKKGNTQQQESPAPTKTDTKGKTKNPK